MYIPYVPAVNPPWIETINGIVTDAGRHLLGQYLIGKISRSRGKQGRHTANTTGKSKCELEKSCDTPEK